MKRSSGGEGVLFHPGDLICHRRYGYRGVVVDLDPSCEANDNWYDSNQTQPDKNQPWYHVLVDGNEATTYVAQENLTLDPSPAPIQHILLEVFFSGFSEGRYQRNERPWDYPSQ